MTIEMFVKDGNNGNLSTGNLSFLVPNSAKLNWFQNMQ